jgi:hypothetical protein
MNILNYVWGFFKKEQPQVPIQMDIIEMEIQIEPSRKRKMIYESDSESEPDTLGRKQLYKQNYNKKLKKTKKRKYKKVPSV